ncbi:MAG TPA: hypothetical protein VNT79_12010 [Phycisphaerae bacterium]|nr:hypothetical protein [Phycisphaerae bacterium]
MSLNRKFITFGVVCAGITAITWQVQSRVSEADQPKPAEQDLQHVIAEAPAAESSGPMASNDARILIEQQHAVENQPFPEPAEPGSDAQNGAMNARNQTVDLAPAPEDQVIPTDEGDGTPGDEDGEPRAPILASRRLSYQAVLTDNLGNALPGPTVNLTFNIYNTAPALVEGPINVNNVPINDGVVSTQIPVLAATFDGGDRLLGVRVNGGAELTPRVQLTTVAYALRVDRVASAELDDQIAFGSGVAPIASGSVQVFNGLSFSPTVELDGSGSRMSTFGLDGLEQIRLYGPSWGEMWLHDSGAGNERTVLLSANSNSGGQLTLYDTNAAVRANMTTSTTGGLLSLYDAAAGTSIFLDGANGDIEAEGVIAKVSAIGGAIKATLTTNGSDQGALRTYDASGDQTIVVGSNGALNSGGLVNVHMANSIWPGMTVDGDDGNSGRLTLLRTNNDDSVILDANSVGSGGQISMQDGDGDETVEILASETPDTGGQIVLRNAAGVSEIEMDAEFGGVGDPGRIVTPVLQITGGADLSEQFDISGDFEPGMVVCIDENNPGKLVISQSAYDTKVAGVVSGAGGVRTGLLMGQRSQEEVDGKNAVALTGRVYCRVDASFGGIKAGDMLTTSSTPGHAMKASDRDRSHGTVIGKAMQPLDSGKGLILVLVNLQ